ncbi:hypothetical protein GCM10023322_59650 [Rugosimonospora acidiphila]|uniref:Cyclic nucleotide-binding domain-containing protein n=1 Tax=Rugosimonospora acidiphila TaxID=556531 RepID=A0ABP9SFV2_9ACTN
MGPDVVETFFGDLARRGHDPALRRGESTGRFDIVRDGEVERWFISIKEGNIEVSRGKEGEPDWVMEADRGDFAGIVSGDDSALAARVRGVLRVYLNGGSQSFGLLTKLFSAPSKPGTRSRARQRDVAE